MLLKKHEWDYIEGRVAEIFDVGKMDINVDHEQAYYYTNVSRQKIKLRYTLRISNRRLSDFPNTRSFEIRMIRNKTKLYEQIQEV